jgi:hypothetical protein
VPQESNYFEEAYELCSHRNSLVARTAETLYEAMRRENAESDIEPKGHFNLRYFFLSVARLLAIHDSSLEVEGVLAKEPCAAIKAFNIPSDSEREAIKQSRFHELGLVESYLALVAEDSKSDGDEFDVHYAICLASKAIDASKLKWIVGKSETTPEQSSEMSEDDFDYWLSGFNSNQ